MQGLVCRLVAGGAKEGEELGWSYIVKPLLPEFYRLPAIKDFFFFLCSSWCIKLVPEIVSAVF